MAFVPVVSSNESPSNNVYVEIKQPFHSSLLHPLTVSNPRFSVPVMINTLPMTTSTTHSSLNSRRYSDILLSTTTPITTINNNNNNNNIINTPTAASSTNTSISSSPITHNKSIKCIDSNSNNFNSNSTNSSPFVIVLPSNIDLQTQLRPVGRHSTTQYDTITAPLITTAPTVSTSNNPPPLLWHHHNFLSSPIVPNNHNPPKLNPNSNSPSPSSSSSSTTFSSLSSSSNSNSNSNSSSNSNSTHNDNNVTHIIIMQDQEKLARPTPDTIRNSIHTNKICNNTNLISFPVFVVPHKTLEGNIGITNGSNDVQIKTEPQSNYNHVNNTMQWIQTQLKRQKLILKEKQSFTPTDQENNNSTCRKNVLIEVGSNNINANSILRKYECRECCKVFNNRHNLSHHMRYHRNDRRFKCKDCEKAFFQKIHLIEHSRIHTGEKPHECSTCGRRFRHSTNLKRHVKAIHLNEHFQCQLCAQSFKRKATLKRHTLKMHPQVIQNNAHLTFTTKIAENKDQIHYL